jgi:hypothetical protein
MARKVLLAMLVVEERQPQQPDYEVGYLPGVGLNQVVCALGVAR